MKTVLITGVGSGIGEALKDKFLSEGYFVVGTYHSEKPPVRDNFVCYELDLSNKESVENCVKTIEGSGHIVDILINNAGVLLDANDVVLMPEKLQETLSVNLIGTANFTEKIIPKLNHPSHIIFVSTSAGSINMIKESTGSHRPGQHPAYNVSKAGLNMYSVMLAKRLLKDGVIVSAVHPGWVRTRMGGASADVSPEESASDIFNLAVSKPESGCFWSKGKEIPW
jgi:NAD(P)-dependent dehydrogenase (short-subunit alcohol dehydrogenase family)